MGLQQETEFQKTGVAWDFEENQTCQMTVLYAIAKIKFPNVLIQTPETF